MPPKGNPSRDRQRQMLLEVEMTGSRKTLGIGLALAWFVCQQATTGELQASNLLGRFRLIVEKENRQGTDDAIAIP